MIKSHNGYVPIAATNKVNAPNTTSIFIGQNLLLDAMGE